MTLERCTSGLLNWILSWEMKGKQDKSSTLKGRVLKYLCGCLFLWAIHAHILKITLVQLQAVTQLPPCLNLRLFKQAWPKAAQEWVFPTICFRSQETHLTPSSSQRTTQTPGITFQKQIIRLCPIGLFLTTNRFS